VRSSYARGALLLLDHTNGFTRKKGCNMAISKLDKLNEKRAQLNAQIQALKQKENQKKRKEDTKRKILIGGVVIKMLNSGEMPKDRLQQILDTHLVKDSDRALFDLQPKPKAKSKAQTLKEELIGA